MMSFVLVISSWEVPVRAAVAEDVGGAGAFGFWLFGASACLGCRF